MDGEVIDALFGLLDEGVTEHLPTEVFDSPVYFLESLVNGNGADGNRGVADDPFAGGVDILAGGEIHHGIAAPLCRPAHFFDFFVDGGGDSRVADIGVDFDEEIAADDHRLGFGMVDVVGYDGTASGHLIADEFRGDEIRSF